MSISNRAEFKRLMLQIECDLQVQAHLKTLLTTADKNIARHRQEQRTVNARIKRTRRVNKRSTRD